MPKAQRSNGAKNNTSNPAKDHVVLNGDARVLYEESRAKSARKHQSLTESIRASQCLSKEDLGMRINTRD
jgi:hypothetical protein